MTTSATKAATGAQTTLSIKSGVSTYVPILQAKTFKFSGQKWTFEDITCLSSPAYGAGVLKEVLPTLVDAGECAMTGIYLPADPGQLNLASAFAAGTLSDFQLQLPPNKVAGQSATGNMFAFSGYVQDSPLPDISYDKVQTLSVVIKLNTGIAMTPGA